MRAVALHLTNSSTFGRRLLENSYLATLERICQHSPEATFVKCSPCALFLSKNAFFSKKICTCAFFVVPLQALSKKSISDKACLITLRRGEGWVSG